MNRTLDTHLTDWGQGTSLLFTSLASRFESAEMGPALHIRTGAHAGPTLCQALHEVPGVVR